MKAGRLDRRVRFFRNEPHQNTTGEEIDVWRPFAFVWAEARVAKGSEQFNAQQRIGKTPMTFRVRWSSRSNSLTVLDRIVFDGRAFDITDVREIGRREGLEIDAYARSEETTGLSPGALLWNGLPMLWNGHEITWNS